MSDFLASPVIKDSNKKKQYLQALWLITLPLMVLRMTLDTFFQDREVSDLEDSIGRRNLQLIIGNKIRIQDLEDTKNQVTSASMEIITTTRHLAPIYELILSLIISFTLTIQIKITIEFLAEHRNSRIKNKFNDKYQRPNAFLGFLE